MPCHAPHGVAFQSCDTAQEEEANWLAGCLLLPRVALVHDLKKRMSAKTIANRRVLSQQIVRYRINVTGANRQVSAARAKSRRRYAAGRLASSPIAR